MQTMREVLRACIEPHARRLAALSRDTGLDYAVLWRFLHGKRTIRWETAEQLQRYFGLTLVDQKTLDGLQTEIRGLNAMVDATKEYTSGTPNRRAPKKMSADQSGPAQTADKPLPATGLHRRLVWVRGTCEGKCAKRRQVCGRCRRCADCGHSTVCDTKGGKA